MVHFSHLYITTGKTLALTLQTFVGKEVSLFFLPRSKCLLISWLQSLLAVIFKPKKIKYAIVSIFSPSVCHEVMGPHAMMLVFFNMNFKLGISLSSCTLIKRFFSSYSLSAIKVVSSAYLSLLTFLLAILIPPCDLSNPASPMMCSAYKLHMQMTINSLVILLSQFWTSQ